jgi:hypothetical protein
MKKSMTTAPEPPFGGGLSYATVRDVWEEGKAWLGACLLLGIYVALPVAAVGHYFGDVTASLPQLPQGLWVFIMLAAGSWFYRGCTIPNLSFSAWLVQMSGLALFMLGLAYAPGWAFVPLYFGLMAGVLMLDALARRGRANRDRRLPDPPGFERSAVDGDDAAHDNERTTTTAQDGITITIIPNGDTKPAAPVVKLANAEVHFRVAPLAGLRLIGFAVWETRQGVRKVTFPGRRYNVRVDRRSFGLLRPSPYADYAALKPLRQAILTAYRSTEEAGSTGSGPDDLKYLLDQEKKQR